MLRRVDFANFRCLRDVSIHLAPLTVFVGANASGKSTVLEGLVAGRQLNPRDTFRQDAQLATRRTIVVDDDRIEETSRTWVGRPSATVSPYTYQILRLDVDQMRQPNTLKAETKLSPNGNNLTNVFSSLTRKQQIALGRDLCKLVPVISDVETRPVGQGTHHLLFQDAYCENVWYTASEVSEGTMLMLAFLLLQYQQGSPDMLGIEEPERGLHPYLLGKLISFLRDLGHGRVGPRRVQIVLATHSAELLEHLQPEEVRFFSRSPEDGSVIVEEAPTTSPEWEQAFREYQQSMGSLWLSGGMGGVPGVGL
jgi:predicted ATPase